MKLVYITNILFPSEYAHGIQVMKMCEVFASNGVDVVLIVPNRKNLIKTDPFMYYGVKNTFKIKKIPCIDFFYDSSSKLVYWIRFISFYISARLYMMVETYDILYSRDLYSAIFFPGVVLEQHSFPKKISSVHKFIFSLTKNLIVLTSFIKKRMIGKGVLENKIHVAPDGVDMSGFIDIQKNITLPEMVTKASLVLGYVGTLKTMGMDKGVDDCIKSLRYLPQDVVLMVVGGERVDIDFYKEKAVEYGLSDRVCFVGKVAHQDVPVYIGLCDILLAPFPENEHYSFFMSPLKIFEYMASKRSIISTTLPSIQEVLKHEHNALLIPPSDPKALAGAIERLSNDSELADRISLQAYKDVVEHYTWDKRVKKILNFIQRYDKISNS